MPSWAVSAVGSTNDVPPTTKACRARFCRPFHIFRGIAGGTQSLYHPAKSTKKQGPAHMAQTLDFTAFAVVSKWRDSNPRPFGPEDVVFFGNCVMAIAGIAAHSQRWQPLCTPWDKRRKACFRSEPPPRPLFCRRRHRSSIVGVRHRSVTSANGMNNGHGIPGNSGNLGNIVCSFLYLCVITLFIHFH